MSLQEKTFQSHFVPVISNKQDQSETIDVESRLLSCFIVV